jgi:uncharacterized protein involved in type VI secretion and phage assembly
MKHSRIPLLALSGLLVAALFSPGPARAQSADSPGAAQGPWFARALVLDLNDPDRMSRVKIKFPAPGRDVEAWAFVAVPLGGNRTGLWALPEVGDQVLVGFEHGDLNAPVVIGTLWNGEAPPPCERCS